MDALIARMIRAAKLEVALYEEVEADTQATSQALLVVIIASLAGGIGGGLGRLFAGGGLGGLILGLILGLIIALVGWFLWSFVTYFVGTRFLGGTATYGELLRTIGFSDSPAVFQILVFIPVLGGIISFLAGIWALVAMVVAVRQALDFTTGKAIATVVIGWVAMVILFAILTALGIGGAMMLG